MLGCRLLALGFVVVLGGLLTRYPPGAVGISAAVALLAAYAALMWFKPAAWLLVVPALLPVLDFSSWTGWFYVREGDFLILATLAVGYWKIVPQRSPRPLSLVAVAAVALLTCSYAISAYLGMREFPALDVNSFATYQSPYNSIRVLLGFVWALLLLPMLARSLGDDDSRLRRYFFPGMTLGLGLAALVTFWERLAFTGVLDFASDYRVTGSFSDMHVGGATLDGYLMLTLPFAAIWALSGRNYGAIGAAGAAFLLGTYATLVTFTRSTYVAYALAMAVVLACFLSATRVKNEHGGARPLALALVAPLLAYLLVREFAVGGYRLLAAALGLLTAAFVVGAPEFRHWSGRIAGVAAALLCGAMLAMMAWSPRSVYVSYALAALLLGGGILVFWFARDRKLGPTLTLASFPVLALGVVLIAWYWGGGAAVPDALLAALAAIGLVGYNQFAARPLWSLSRNNVVVAVLVALVLGLFIPVMGNYRMQERFTEVGKDLADRTTHWRDSLNLIPPGWVAGAFGMGLGSFPRNYFWGNHKGEIPGQQAYRSEGGNTYLRLGGPRYEIGFGEPLKVFQTIDMRPQRTMRLSFDLRSNAGNAVLLVGICEKWLIYPVGCVKEFLTVPVGNNDWKRFDKTFNSAGLGQLEWFGRRPVHLSIASDKAGTHIDVDNVALVDDAGRNLITNGDFSAGHAWWYFSSDRHHLPWHPKNILLHVLIEQGWCGVVLIFPLCLYALFVFARRALRGDLLAAAPLAALAGFLVVGFFDSLLDVSRLTLLFYLLVFLALIPEKARALTPSR